MGICTLLTSRDTVDVKHILAAYQDVEAYRCQPGNKRLMAGNKPADPASRGNRAGRNGTGRLLIIDVDRKNGANLDNLLRNYPGLIENRTLEVNTATPGDFHLVYRLPQNFFLRRDRPSELVTAVEIPTFYMLPGSKVGAVTYGDQNNGRPIAELPWDLQLVLSGDWRETDTPAPGAPGNADIEMLLARFSRAGAGERNRVFTEVSIPILRVLGVDVGAEQLRCAYSGDDYEELEDWIRSAVRKVGSSAAPVVAARGKYSIQRERVLRGLVDAVRYGVWRGRSAAVDRRVMLAIALKAYGENELWTRYASETLAKDVGIKRATVVESIRRLREQRWLASPVADGYVDHTLVCSETVRLLSKGEYPLRDMTDPYSLYPLHPVWRGTGLQGRHAHVFDLVDSGIGVQSELVKATGASRSSVSETVSRLLEVGLLRKEGATLVVAEGVVDIADQLCEELGAFEAYLAVQRAIDGDHDRLRQHKEDKLAAAMEPAERRMREEQQLAAELGLL